MLLLDPFITPESLQASSHTISRVSVEVTTTSLALRPPDASLSKPSDFCEGSPDLLFNSLVEERLLPHSSPSSEERLRRNSSITDAHRASSSGSTWSKQYLFNLINYANDSKSYLLFTSPYILDLMPPEVPAASATQRSLLPGATALTGNRFFTAQARFTLLSAREVAKQTVPRIPSGPKSNCYVILSIGIDLMDYEKSSVNKQLIQDKIRDGTGSWDDVNTSNFDFNQVHDKILTSVKLKTDVHPRPH